MFVIVTMRLCNKHQLLMTTKVILDDHIDVLSEFNEKLDVASYQEKIEYRKNNCQVCNLWVKRNVLFVAKVVKQI